MWDLCMLERETKCMESNSSPHRNLWLVACSSTRLKIDQVFLSSQWASWRLQCQRWFPRARHASSSLTQIQDQTGILCHRWISKYNDGNRLHPHSIIEQEILITSTEKGLHFINVQIICDANVSLLNDDAPWPGGTHDSVTVQSSSVGVRQ